MSDNPEAAVETVKRYILILTKPLNFHCYSREAYEASFHQRFGRGQVGPVSYGPGRYNVESRIPSWNNIMRTRCLVITGTENGIAEDYIRQNAKQLGVRIIKISGLMKHPKKAKPAKKQPVKKSVKK